MRVRPFPLLLLALVASVGAVSALRAQGAPAPVAEAKPTESKPAASRTRPRNVAELNVAMNALTEAGDMAGLFALCRDLTPKALNNDAAAASTLALCRARGLHGMRKRDEAAEAYREVIKLGSTGAVHGLPSGQQDVGEARYRLGEIAEDRWREYPVCLRELGIFWGSRREAQEKLALLRDAERAYREAMAALRPPWQTRAAFRITAMQVDFYREVSGHTAPNFRGLQGPPPLATARTESADTALNLLLDPGMASWPRLLRTVTESAARRIGNSNADPELAEAAAALARDTQQLGPPPRSPKTAPWPARGGVTRGWTALETAREAVVFVKEDGTRTTEPVISAGKLLAEVVKGGAGERFAPEAAVALGQGGYRAALPVLSAAALGPDAEVAVAAVHALGDLGGAPEVQVLLEAYARATPPGESPEPYATAAGALFGMRERVTEALIRIGRREPQAIERLAVSGLPARESAYVFFNAAHRDLRFVLAQHAHHSDPVVAIYNALGVSALSAQEGRAVLRELSQRRGTECWANHALQAMGPPPEREEWMPFPSTTGEVIP